MYSDVDLGYLYPVALTSDGQIWYAEVRSMLVRQSLSWLVYAVTHWWQKNLKFYHFLDLGIL